MLSISIATSAADFEIAAGFVREFGEWDAIQAQPYGVSRDEVIREFHSDTADTLAEKFCSVEARLFLARWSDVPAGNIAFNVFDDTAVEIHRFYVDEQFRGKGIGKALMRTLMSEVDKGPRRTVLLHTTPYMKDAISVYEAFGFRTCDRFRETPDRLRSTDHFMSRTI